jgi:hypothetical protein
LWAIFIEETNMQVDTRFFIISKLFPIGV